MRTPIRHPGRHFAQGLTLVEMLVVMAIMAILLTIAVPAFNDASLGNKLNAISNGFASSAQLARSEAIKRNRPVTLCASSDAETCSVDWSDGWIVWDEAADEIIQAEQPVSSGFLLQATGGVDSIVFLPTGVGATVATLTACRYSPSAGTQKRVITTSVTGRVDVEKAYDATSCP
jgi:type IV fimbrial biogenesis protein FimT